MNAKDLKPLMEKFEIKSEETKSKISKIAEKIAFEAGLTYHPETDEEWSYIDFDNSRNNCIVLRSTNILTVNDVISYSQHDCLKLLKKAIDELQNIMFKKIKMNKATKKLEIRGAGIKYEA